MTPTQAIPASLAGLPFIQHVAAAGATIFDLGSSHGLRLAAARNGDEFRMFAVLPNGQAAVEGVPVELTVSQLETIAGGNLTSLGNQGGFVGLFVRSGPQFQVFYAAPDGQVVIPGILRDAAGKNLTRPQVASIPGAIPTVEVTNSNATSGPMADLTSTAPRGSEATLAAVEKATYGTLGPASAPQLFMLIDPQCIYSVRSYQTLRSFAQAGKIRLSVIPLSVLDYEDHGQSTKSALALLSKSPDQLLGAWQAGDVGGPIAPEAETRLQQNMAIATAIGLKGTPTFVWRKTDGSVGRIDGVPTDVSALISSVGS
jgi:thiol:disulfide interchange protein DsbG